MPEYITAFIISTPAIAIVIFALWLRKRADIQKTKAKWYHPLLAVLITPLMTAFPSLFYIIFQTDTFGLVAYIVSMFLSALLIFSAVFYVAVLFWKPRKFSTVILLTVCITLILMSITTLWINMKFDEIVVILWLAAIAIASFCGTVFWLYMKVFYKNEDQPIADKTT